MSSNDSIRKAAILISLLDTRSADALLDVMGEELADRVRHAVMDLDDVSPQEQNEVLSDFLARPGAERIVDGGVEMELSGEPDDRPAPTQVSGPVASSGRAAAPPLRFLEEIAPSIVAETLLREGPQTVAVVVAHLAPEYAAEVLERLPPALATEALSRMAWLTAPVPEALADLELELRRRLAPLGELAGGTRGGLNGVRAVLASLPEDRREELVHRLARQDERLSSRLDRRATPRTKFPETHRDGVSLRYRLDDSHAQGPSPRGPQESPAPLFEFEDLAKLTDRDLGRITAAADLQMLALALIEADERLSRRLLRSLPPAEAALVRQRISQPGPIRLKDIDFAQRRIADLARQLARSGTISLPDSRHFAAAA